MRLRSIPVLVVMLSLCSEPASAQQEPATQQPSGVKPADGNTGLIVGGVALGVTYLGSIVADHRIDDSLNFPELYVPLLGPFLTLANYDDKVDPFYSGRNRDKVLLVASGVVQTASAALIVRGLLKRGRRDGSAAASRLPSIFLGPVSGGFVASCRLRF